MCSVPTGAIGGNLVLYERHVVTDGYNEKPNLKVYRFSVIPTRARRGGDGKDFVPQNLFLSFSEIDSRKSWCGRPVLQL